MQEGAGGVSVSRGEVIPIGDSCYESGATQLAVAADVASSTEYSTTSSGSSYSDGDVRSAQFFFYLKGGLHFAQESVPVVLNAKHI
jgi:hypothetical protein